MSEGYRKNERRYWNERIRRLDRYSSIGQQSLPGSINRHRKEGLFRVLDSVLNARGMDLRESLVLDAGCGTGVYSDYYASMGALVRGIDLSHEALRSGRRHGVPGAFCVAELSGVPFFDDLFDIVHTFSVLYHIVDDAKWRESLRELTRVLRSGGLLLLRVEWVEHTIRISDHVKHRGKDEYLEVLVEEEGLELEETRPIRDVVRLEPLFTICHRVMPRRASERLGAMVARYDLLKDNPDQKVVIFRKPDPDE